MTTTPRRPRPDDHAQTTTPRRLRPDDHAHLERHLADFINASNSGRRLKTLKGLTPYEFICKCRTSDQESFILNPLHHIPGLNS